MMLALSLAAFLVAFGSALMFLCNACAFRKASLVACDDPAVREVSVLLPARNEAAVIRGSLASILANESVRLEVVVLDDQSEDTTAAMVQEVAVADSRVRLVRGRQLPDGWCGKQFACWQLAGHATYDALLFLDADVRLAPDAIRRAVQLQEKLGVDLLSGFPRQLVGSFGEALLLPLIHVILLTFLPFVLMRQTRMPAAAAGCGQFFLTTRTAYRRSGGHEKIKNSLHDGLKLPRSYRDGGHTTDVFDAADIACCRMYQGWRATWSGLMKNAHEGFANPRRILPFSGLLVTGWLLPIGLAVTQLARGRIDLSLALCVAAIVLTLLPRLWVAWRYDRGWAAALLYPVSIVLFLAIQWIALIQHQCGIASEWRGRSYRPVCI